MLLVGTQEVDEAFQEEGTVRLSWMHSAGNDHAFLLIDVALLLAVFFVDGDEGDGQSSQREAQLFLTIESEL